MSAHSLPNRQPDASGHDPRQEYLRSLLVDAGLSQREAARRIGVSERMMRYYLADESADHRPAPYVVQFALEELARRHDVPDADNNVQD
ncbi:MAG: helix-turn-helix transcriptional regulator [Thermomonas sp.]|uniref:helix-turn-helix domain-containing protein n=1 Tax=Thermomonas sp. TaxID=1971895 RepID=UPI0039E45DB4